MKELNFSQLLDEFIKEQEKDRNFFEKLADHEVSEGVLTYIYQRLYLRRKFLAQFHNIRPEVRSEEERKALLGKIGLIITREEFLAHRLQELKAALNQRLAHIKQHQEVSKAYKGLSRFTNHL